MQICYKELCKLKISPKKDDQNHLRPAVKAVTFGIRKNEIFGLIGPNGSGKSTLLKLITKQLELDDGEIIVILV